MFRSTLRRLAVVNSMVFLLIFVAFGTVVHGYLAYRLFDKVDDALRFRTAAFRLAGGKPVFTARSRAMFDPRIVLLLRDADGGLIHLIPFPGEEYQQMAAAAQTVAGGPETREYGGHVYRILSIPYAHGDNLFQAEGGETVVGEVIGVVIVDSEVALLEHLRWIIYGGLVAGVLIIFLAGYFLARRAMVPIEEAWEKQQQFMADASHELRSPLAVIQSNTELILRHPSHTVEEESERVTSIARESRRMTRLIASLLTLARSDANHAELRLEAVDLSSLMTDITGQLKPVAELQGIDLGADVAPGIELTADRERMHQLIVILLDNALKYTEIGGRIRVTGSRTDRLVTIRVEDTGCGISAEELPRIFDRFYRGDKARSRERGGAGLGLSIAKWVVEKHGGKITAVSQAGKGTSVTVTLPYK